MTSSPPASRSLLPGWRPFLPGLPKKPAGSPANPSKEGDLRTNERGFGSNRLASRFDDRVLRPNPPRFRSGHRVIRSDGPPLRSSDRVLASNGPALAPTCGDVPSNPPALRTGEHSLGLEEGEGSTPEAGIETLGPPLRFVEGAGPVRGPESRPRSRGRRGSTGGGSRRSPPYACRISARPGDPLARAARPRGVMARRWGRSAARSRRVAPGVTPRGSLRSRRAGLPHLAPRDTDSLRLAVGVGDPRRG